MLHTLFAHTFVVGQELWRAWGGTGGVSRDQSADQLGHLRLLITIHTTNPTMMINRMGSHMPP